MENISDKKDEKERKQKNYLKIGVMKKRKNLKMNILKNLKLIIYLKNFMKKVRHKIWI